MDSRLYLVINRLARESFWAHGLARVYSSYLGICLLAVLGALALFSTRRARRARPALSLSAQACLLAATAFGAGAVELSSRLIGRPAPYVALRGVEVLVSRSGGSSMPSLDGAIAGAIVLSLWLSREVLLACLATVLAGLLAYSGVYVGASYPSDVLAGIAFGALFVGSAYGLVVPRLSAALEQRKESLLSGTALLVAPRPGPASTPTALGSSGSVRLLSDQRIRPRQLASLDGGRASGVPSS